MGRFRFSLSALLGFVTFAAVACAALATPTKLWQIAIAAITLACLFYAPLAAFYGSNARRAFWVGFAVVGWSYFLTQSHALPTQMATQVLMELRYGSSPRDVAAVWFSQTVDWIWSFVLAFVGGLVAVRLYLRQEQRAEIR